MGNTEIEHRLNLSGLHPEDAEEIRRIFDCLIHERQLAVLEEWNSLVERVKLRRETFEEEQKIIIVDPLRQVAESYEDYLRNIYRKKTNKELSSFQTNI